MHNSHSIVLPLLHTSRLPSLCHRHNFADLDPADGGIKSAGGIVPSSVILLHFYAKGHITYAFLLNEGAIIFIGIGTTLVINLYMPCLDSKLLAMRAEIENNFKAIFEEMISYLQFEKMSWDGSEITETAALLEEGKKLAFRDIENRLSAGDTFYYDYFSMRAKQFEILEGACRLWHRSPIWWNSGCSLPVFWKK